MGCGVSALQSNRSLPPAEAKAAPAADNAAPTPAAEATPPLRTLFIPCPPSSAAACPTPRTSAARMRRSSAAVAAAAATPAASADKAIGKGDLVEVVETGVVARVSSVCLTFPVGLCRVVPVEDVSGDQTTPRAASAVWRTSKLQRVPDLVFECESSPTASSASGSAGGGGSSTAGSPTSTSASTPSHLPSPHRLRSSLKATLHPSTPKRPPADTFPCHDVAWRWSVAPPMLTEAPEALTFLPRRPCKQRAASAETSYARQERVAGGARNFNSLPQVRLFGNRDFAPDSPPCITLTPLS